MVGLLGFAFIMLVLAPFLGTVLGKTYVGIKSLFDAPEPLPYHELPAGRIHLFHGNRYLNSSPENPYEHPELDWASGRLRCALSSDLLEHPEYQPTLIGTIQIFKPDREKGLVAVIIDNEKLLALGLKPFKLMDAAQVLVDRTIPEQTIRVY
jgi:hypothetical protein